VFRTLGTKLGILTALLDMGKAALAVWLGMLIIGSDAFSVAGHDIHIQAAQCLAAIMVMVGHNWSAYIGFKGGKGVACFIRRTARDQLDGSPAWELAAGIAVA